MADLKKAKAEAEQIRKSNRKKILKAEMAQPHYRFPISKIVDFHSMKGDTATIEALKTWESEMPDGAVRTGLAKSRKLLEKGKTEHWLAPLVYRAVKNTDLGDKIFERFCQNKPPCPTALWKLTNQVCPTLYPFAISKPVLRSFNLQLCFM